MKDHVLDLVRNKADQSQRLNIMREYLQAYILRNLYDEGFFRSTAFLGGTALRFLYDLQRFSEDLDFSLTVERPHYDFEALMRKVKHELQLAGYDVSVTIKTENTAWSSTVKFSGLLFEAGLSSLKAQNFAIKIEVDANPPQGAGLKTAIVNKYFPISFLAYDVPSLMAGKIHDLLSRKYTKGRDFFDLGWYLSRWKNVEPNLILLANALKQTGWPGDIPKTMTWRQELLKVVEKVDWQVVAKDVERFLENPSDMKVLSKENIILLLEGKPD